LIALAACSAPVSVSEIAGRPDVSAALAAVSASSIEGYLEVLASDSLQGRRPGTLGEQLTVGYLSDELRKLGLEPAGTEGYLQPFDIEARDLGFQGRLGPIALVGGSNVAVAPWPDSLLAFEQAPIVFAGYGIVSDELGRDDIGDVEGAVVIVLEGGPPDDSRYDDVSGYGPKTAALQARGAAAMLLVWRDEDSPWDETRWFYHPPFFTRFPIMDRVPILEMSESVLDSIPGLAGMSSPEWYAHAASDDFAPIRLSDRLDGQLTSRPVTFQSNNVIAALPGSDPELADEWVVLTAHWDHLGFDTARMGDQVYNGALDNASGSAVLLELARAVATLDPRPRRGLAFVWTGAEEFGLRGAKAYVSTPAFPITQTVANINFDFQNPWGMARDLIIIGPGNTTLEDNLEEVVQYQGRYLGPELWPERDYYQHSDQWEFAKAGVPALFPASGLDLTDGGRVAGEAHDRRYFAERYHSPADEVVEDLSYEALAVDTRAFLLLALTVSERSERPAWKDGTAYPEYARLHSGPSD